MNDSVIVLCGGRSTRMGRDKAALPFGAETLLARVVRTARTIADDVVVVGDPRQPMPPQVRVMPDAVEGLGPLAGLSTGLAAVDGDRALLVACDMPLLSPALLRGLLALAGDHDASVPLVDGVPMTTCAVYATRLGPRAQALLRKGTRSLRALLDEVSVQWVSDDKLRGLDPDLVSFWDCDTPERYQAALRRAGLDQPTL
jgi:molybdopterin-guanine dinucleotide biosynthesis protein A